MISRLAKWTLGVCLGVVALVVAADAALRFTGLADRLKPLVGQRLAQSGLQVSVGGPISAALLPRPRVVAANITLRNGRGQLMAEIERATLDIALSPLMRGDVVTGEIAIERPRISVAIDQDGRSNLDLAVPGASRPLPGGKLLLKGGTLAVDHARMGQFELDLQEITAELGQDWVRAAGKGVFAGKTVSFKAEIEPKANGAHRSTVALDT
ncbi:MAG TPA: AsmA family protein, partial [Reyranellaceae bacterium]|nr:AsmA family protein [Reyranellaceae bacterium]